jgi:chromosome segregation ATPase
MMKGTHRQRREARELLPHALVMSALLAIAAVSPADAATYKWTDEDGKVHYSDKAPPEAPKGATVLDKQARPVKKIDAPLTPEQIKAKAEEEERQKALAKAKDDQARKDRALMASYTSENEIDLARNRAVSTLEAQIKSAQTFIDTLTKQQKALAVKKQSYAGKPLPIELERESASVEIELSQQNIVIRQKQEELEMVAAKYDTIKQRWREILADKERAAAAEREAKAQAPAPAATPGKPGVKPMTTAGPTAK